LELITDPEMYTMIESSIKSGVAGILHRRAEANNKYMSDFKTDEPSSYIVNSDANNLYGYAVSKPLPYEHFSFLNADKLKSFDFDSVDAEGS